MIENSVEKSVFFLDVNSIAIRKAKIVYNFGLSECNRVNENTIREVTLPFSFLPSFSIGINS